MTFSLLNSVDDKDMEIIKSVYDAPCVARFVCINKEMFWSYVTATENVYFFKVYVGGALAGTVQCELCDGVLYLALVVLPEYQKKGIGTAIVKSVIDGKTGLDFNEIQVSIDEKNIASLRLFEKCDFVRTGHNDELVDFQYVV